MKALVLAISLTSTLSLSCDEWTINLSEKQIDEIPALINGKVHDQESPGEGLIYLGRCDNWYRFFYVDGVESDAQSKGVHEEFISRDLKLIYQSNGKEIDKVATISKVVSVDIDSRTLILEPPHFDEIFEKAHKKTESTAEQGGRHNGDKRRVTP